MNLPVIKLNDGHSIPQVGLGLWKVKDQAEFDNAFETGIKAGYRHFDSAQAYDNEHFLGQIWNKFKLNRHDLFITTKISVQHFGHNKAKSTFTESLSKLRMDYVDLLLLHFPVTLLRKSTWKALEEIKSDGGAKSIGVSNFTIRHLEEMKNYASILPAVNQVELHIFLQQPELVKYCKDNNILIEAYSPLAHAKAMDNSVINNIAQKYNKSYAQIMLRWLIEQDLVILPKSVTPIRIEENIDLFDFSLDENDMTILNSQNSDLRTCWSPVHVP